MIWIFFNVNLAKKNRNCATIVEYAVLYSLYLPHVIQEVLYYILHIYLMLYRKRCIIFYISTSCYTGSGGINSYPGYCLVSTVREGDTLKVYIPRNAPPQRYKHLCVWFDSQPDKHNLFGTISLSGLKSEKVDRIINFFSPKVARSLPAFGTCMFIIVFSWRYWVDNSQARALL